MEFHENGKTVTMNGPEVEALIGGISNRAASKTLAAVSIGSLVGAVVWEWSVGQIVGLLAIQAIVVVIFRMAIEDISKSLYQKGKGKEDPEQ